VPGTEQPLADDDGDAEIGRIAADIGYPVMVKAVAGGGGKGMRLVERADDLSSAIRAARSEAASAFGDSSIYLERRLLRPRHIEVQILADRHGSVIPFVERECSIQRRHQKVIEESPSPAITPELRAQLTAAAASVARAVGYTNAGTIEFLLADDGRFYFLEMNTRLQVEHPVTEMVTGVDLVEWQIRIGRGERLTIDAAAAGTPRGHAIECRIYAEDPDAGFMPSPGRITALRVPDGPGIRDDSGAEAGGEVPIYYDPLISKLIAWGADRPQAIARMQRALAEYDVRGIRTSVGFFRWMLRQPAFLEADVHTGLLDELLQQRRGTPFSERDPSLEEVALVAAAVHAASRTIRAGGRQTRSGPQAGKDGLARHSSEGATGAWKSQARREGVRR
jgi:acetyl-CoA carboxylase, biotin carboxylase subunit